MLSGVVPGAGARNGRRAWQRTEIGRCRHRGSVGEPRYPADESQLFVGADCRSNGFLDAGGIHVS